MSDTCVCCGREVPEGRQVCPSCERINYPAPDAFLPDGTPLYLKTNVTPCWDQLRLYKLLFGKE